MTELREKFAEAAHDRWVRIKGDMFNVALELPAAGILIIDTDSLELWARRCDMPYARLTLEEQEAYRVEADVLLAIIDSLKEPEEPELEPRFVTLRLDVDYWNLRAEDGTDVGDLEPGAVFEVIGEDDTRLHIAAWAHKSGFKEEL